MNHTVFAAASHRPVRSQAALSRLVLLSLVAALGLGVFGWAAPAQAGGYSTSITPSTILPSQTQTYTLTTTNVSPGTGELLGSSHWTIPAGFTSITVATPVATGGKSWTAGYFPGNKIHLAATTDANRLADGESVQVDVTMTAPAAGVVAGWVTDAKEAINHLNGGFTHVNGEPTILVGNTAPVAVADSDTTAEETALSGASVLGNDSDAENQTLSAILVTGPTNAASFTLNGDGTFSYTPAADFNGTDSFDYKANDGIVDGNTVTVTITVTSVNDAPVAVADSDTTNEDTALSGASVLGNDTDTENDTLSAVLVTGPSNAASFTLNGDGTFSYTPAAEFSGTDSFDYKANDGNDDSNTVTVTITVTAVNDAPVAVADSGTTGEDTALSGATVLGNDTDNENDTLTAVLVTGPSNAASFTLNTDGTFSYTPAADFNGTDSFDYKANDGTNDSNTVTVNITVTAVGDAPVAVADSDSTSEDTALSGATVLGNDTDAENDTLSAVLVTGPSNAASFTLNTDGTFSYSPAANFNGTDSFDYKANDGTDDSNTVTVTITVTAVNDAPVAVADTDTTAEDTALSGASVLGNDTDTENDTLSAVLVTGPSNAANFTLNTDGTFSYTPNANFNGTDSFDYKANDGTDDSNTVTVTITVTAVNDAPVAVGETKSTVQDTTLNVAAPGVLSNDTDTENDTLTAVLDTNVSNGNLTLNTDGSFTYVPNTSFSGTDSFTYHANDGGLDSNVVTVTINVQKTFTIDGLVRYGNVTPVVGASVTRTGGVTVVTDSNGRFTFTGVLPGLYTITPSMPVHAFSPLSTGLSVTTANRACNFNATRINQITGRITTTNSSGISGVVISRGVVSTVSNSAGYYTLPAVPNGNYTLTATLSGHTFTPSTRAVTINNNDAINQHFVSGFTISGRVHTSNGVGIGGVIVSTGGGPIAISNSAGYYTIHNVQPGTYTLSASLSGSTFSPASPTATVTNANVSGPNFIRVTGP